MLHGQKLAHDSPMSFVTQSRTMEYSMVLLELDFTVPASTSYLESLAVVSEKVGDNGPPSALQPLLSDIIPLTWTTEYKRSYKPEKAMPKK